MAASTVVMFFLVLGMVVFAIAVVINGAWINAQANTSLKKFANLCSSDRYYEANKVLCEDFRNESDNIQLRIDRLAIAEQERLNEEVRQKCLNTKYYFANFNTCDRLGVTRG